MDETQRQRYVEIKAEVTAIERVMDELHKEEAAILADIDALEQEARERQLPELQQQLLRAHTQLVASGSQMARVALDLQVPPTVFEPAMYPHEIPAPTDDQQKKSA